MRTAGSGKLPVPITLASASHLVRKERTGRDSSHGQGKARVNCLHPLSMNPSVAPIWSLTLIQ